MLLYETNKFLRFGPGDKYARTDKKLASAEVGTAQNVLHRFAFCHSINNYFEFGFVLCR